MLVAGSYTRIMSNIFPDSEIDTGGLLARTGLAQDQALMLEAVVRRTGTTASSTAGSFAEE